MSTRPLDDLAHANADQKVQTQGCKSQCCRVVCQGKQRLGCCSEQCSTSAFDIRDTPCNSRSLADDLRMEPDSRTIACSGLQASRHSHHAANRHHRNFKGRCAMESVGANYLSAQPGFWQHGSLCRSGLSHVALDAGILICYIMAGGAYIISRAHRAAGAGSCGRQRIVRRFSKGSR